jgi:hypothetical protein
VVAFSDGPVVHISGRTDNDGPEDTHPWLAQHRSGQFMLVCT